jgi:LacI family transcriptional regulator
VKNKKLGTKTKIVAKPKKTIGSKSTEVKSLQRQGRANIEHVAKLAGVSIKTVSRVFNNEPNVAVATRDRVQKAIAELDYIPNHSARSLAGRQSKTLGLLYDNPSPSYNEQVQRGALGVCREAGYELLLHPCKFEDKCISEEVINLHRQGRFDGIILTPPISDLVDVVDAFVQAGVPIVAIAPADLRKDILQVVTDDFKTCVAMTRVLYGLGHRKIAFIAGHPEHRAVGLRLEGFRAAMHELMLPISDEYIVQGYNTFESGERAGASLLTLPDPPTAIFAANDDMAAGVMRVAFRFGVSIPDSLSIVGFDDIPLATQVWPELSSVRQPIEAMSAKAVELLIAKLKGETDIPVDVLLKSGIMLRGTTGTI